MTDRLHELLLCLLGIVLSLTLAWAGELIYAMAMLDD